MDTFRTSGLFSTQDLVHLNAAQLHLQVATVADISTADGKSLEEHAIQGFCSPQRVSTILWIRHPDITLRQRKLWLSAVLRLFAGGSVDGVNVPPRSTKLLTPLGVWIAPTHQS